jgi:hypothetical protein
MHEPPAATADMAVLPGVFGSSFDRLRTSSPCDVLSSTPQVRAPVVARHATHTPRKRLALRERLRCAWDDHLHDLATASRA